MGLVSEQSLYNLTDRMIELEVVPACRTLGLGLIPWSPLARGILGGILPKHTEGRRSSEDVQKSIKKLRPQINAYEKLCAEMGEKPASIALAWLLHNPVVTAPIIGPRTIEQLDESLCALEIKLSDEVLKKLDAIWPGPGGEAPEAYAW
jgi:aryl-alcohol dehydrogenase-like predicted oxidoreductase